jgi:hypothetical protein
MESRGLTIYCEEPIACDVLPVRGVGWVLKWAGTIAVLVLAATILASFAFLLAAERVLANAAAAGLREAALPRATSESVAAVIRQQLCNGGILARATKMRLEQNGQPMRGVVRPKSGDQLAIALSIPTGAIVPRWLPMPAWLSAGTVQWHAKRLIN